jgi:hypothetical protein
MSSLIAERLPARVVAWNSLRITRDIRNGTCPAPFHPGQATKRSDTGAYLGKVEVWAVPTGTGIGPEEYVLVGNARRQTVAGRNEVWLFPIDCTHLIPSTEVFVKGFDQTGKTVGAKSLPYRGATEIKNAICGGG